MKITERHLRPEQIAERCALCPACKEPLVARDSSRRFMENDTYAECVNGHIWALVDPDTGKRHGDPNPIVPASDESDEGATSHG